MQSAENIEEQQNDQHQPENPDASAGPPSAISSTPTPNILAYHQAGDVPSPGYRPSQIPIGLGPVILEHLSAPSTVSHVWPVLLVEAGSEHEQFLIDFQNESFFNRIDGEGTPRDGK